jgi:hypothetical protein
MKHPQRHIVEVEYNGTIHQGEYTEQNRVVVVTYGRAKNQAILGNHLSAEFEARQLLREILEANNWQF